MQIKQIKDDSLIDNYLYRKPQPNLSIKIQQVQQKTKHTFKCTCEMCRQYDGKKIIQMLNQKTQTLNKKIKEKIQDSKIPSQYYLEILKKLVLPHHKIVKRGVDIYIPQICFFKDGESKGLFMNRQLDDYSIKKIHKNSVNPGLIQRILNQRRRQYKQDIKKKLGLTDRRPITQNKSFVQKDKKEQPTQQKDSIMIKYTDGFQSMITQTQFIMLTLKRKQDPIWKTIQIIKNIITVNDQINNMVFVKYQKGNIKYQNLLDRSRTLARIYAQNIILGQSKYISNEEENAFSLELLKKDKKCYAQYAVYRIVSFIEYFYDQEIIKLSCKILINQLNKPYLIDVTSYKKKTLVRFIWTHDTYKKKLDQQQRKYFIDKAINVTQELQQKSKLISCLMESKYNEMKLKYGITNQDSDNQQEVKNNQFWKKMHPQFNGLQLSQVLMHDKNITVNSFKKKYLGYKQQKKPIIKQFNTHMIKVLHKTTPKLKISEYHEIPFKPNQSGFFSSRRPNTCSFSKRSSYTAITTPRKQLLQQQSPQSPNKASRSSKRLSLKSSRTPTSATYRKSRKSGCHLHVAPGQYSISKDFLNIGK